jgi:hypothetical protein
VQAVAHNQPQGNWVIYYNVQNTLPLPSLQSSYSSQAVM